MLTDVFLLGLSLAPQASSCWLWLLFLAVQVIDTQRKRWRETSLQCLSKSEAGKGEDVCLPNAELSPAALEKGFPYSPPQKSP